MEIAGLLFNVAGTLLLFFFGFPQPAFESEVSLALEDNTPVGDGMTAKEYDGETAKKKRLYRFMAYFSLSLILLGFLIQLINAL